MLVRLENSGWPGDVSQDMNASEITSEHWVIPAEGINGCEPDGAAQGPSLQVQGPPPDLGGTWCRSTWPAWSMSPLQDPSWEQSPLLKFQ